MNQCPVCKSDAEELNQGLFDGHAIKCTTHGEIEFSDSVRVERWNEPRGAWERALTKARMRGIKSSPHETLIGKRPRIMTYDF
jgi:hypothetical protein